MQAFSLRGSIASALKDLKYIYLEPTAQLRDKTFGMLYTISKHFFSRMYKLKIFSQEFYIRTLLFILYSLRKYKRQLGIYTIFRYFNAELR